MEKASVSSHRLPGYAHDPEAVKPLCSAFDKQNVRIRTHNITSLNQATGWGTLSVVAENSQEPPAVFSQTPAHHQSSLHPRSTELHSRLDVSCGSLPQWMEVEYCTCADVVEQIWEGRGRFHHLTRQCTIPDLWLEMSGKVRCTLYPQGKGFFHHSVFWR